MKTLLIHAGLPKNGSSALQVLFAKNQRALYDFGIDYLTMGEIDQARAGQITSGNGGYLARSLLRPNHESFYPGGPELYNSMLRNVELSPHDVGIISSEFFSLTQPETLSNWRKDLEKLGVTLKYSFYARRQDQYLISSYIQRVKRHGCTQGPNEFVLSEYKKIHFLNYYWFSSEVESALGKGNVLPLLYESAHSFDGGIFSHFINATTGATFPPLAKDEVVNTSPSPLEVKLMLAANKYSPRMQFSDFLVQDSIAAGRSGKYRTHSMLKDEVLAEVTEHFRENNSLFFSEYCGGKSFPIAPAAPYVDLEATTFTAEDVLDIVAGMLVRLDRRLSRLEAERK